MRKSDTWHIKEDLARRMHSIGDSIMAHIKNSDDRYIRLEERLWKLEHPKKKLK